MRRSGVLQIMAVSVQLCSTGKTSCTCLLPFPSSPPGQGWGDRPLWGHVPGQGVVQGFSTAEGHGRVQTSPLKCRGCFPWPRGLPASSLARRTANKTLPGNASHTVASFYGASGQSSLLGALYSWRSRYPPSRWCLYSSHPQALSLSLSRTVWLSEVQWFPLPTTTWASTPSPPVRRVCTSSRPEANASLQHSNQGLGWIFLFYLLFFSFPVCLAFSLTFKSAFVKFHLWGLTYSFFFVGWEWYQELHCGWSEAGLKSLSIVMFVKAK